MLKLYERTDNRKAYRNGYKTRKLNTRVGNLILNIVSELRLLSKIV
ncbi:transposase [Thermodesulfobium sp.]